MGENNEVFIAYKIDGIAFIALAKTQLLNALNVDAELKLIDFNGDDLDELCITYHEMDNNNGFESGFELASYGILILNVKSQLMLADAIYSYEYMEYTDMGEEDDVHGKIDEDPEVNYCQQHQQLTFIAQGFSITANGNEDKSTDEFCVGVLHIGTYTYQKTLQLFERVD